MIARGPRLYCRASVWIKTATACTNRKIIAEVPTNRFLNLNCIFFICRFKIIFINASNGEDCQRTNGAQERRESEDAERLEETV